MDRQRLRQVLTEGIDKLVTHRWLSMITDEQKAVLLACRQVILSDDSVVDKIITDVGPFSTLDEITSP